MRIAISGKSGCGNTTVSSLLAEKLNYKLINFTFRQMAEERNVDFWELCKLAETDYSIDRELDRRQVEMALKEENCVLGSRLAIWMLKEADVKVWLNASASERARRVYNREGGRLEDIIRQTENRDEKDTMRYKKIYGIDNNRPKADIFIETEGRTPMEIVNYIIKFCSTVQNK